MGCLAAMATVWMSVSCTNPKDERIAMLEEDLKAVSLDRDQAKADRTEAEVESQRLRNELAGKDGEFAGYQTRYDAQSGEVRRLKEDLAKLEAELSKKPSLSDDWKYGEGLAMRSIPGGVLFSSGSAKLSKGGRKILDSIASKLNGEFSSMKVLVVGHTDSDPIRKTKKIWKDNYELSAERGLTVARFLVNRGVAGSRVIAGGAGEHQPAAPNASKANKSKNRRVEIYAYNPSKLLK
jgi:chemotaxis protein MotB